MKLSDYTKKILENFSSINNSVIIRATPSSKNCTTIRVVNIEENVMAECTVDEVFQHTAPIYDMQAVLSIASSFGPDTELNFNDTHLRIDEDKSVVTINYANENQIRSPKGLPSATNETTFEITQTQFSKVMQMTKFLGAKTICVDVTSGVATVKVKDIKNPDSNVYSVEVGKAEGPDTSVILDSSLFRFLPGDYIIKVDGSKKFVELQHAVDQSLRYVVVTLIV